MKRVTYIGKKVSVGIDVHKKTYAITCLVDQRVEFRGTIPANPQALVELLNKRFEGAEIQSVYEAGFSGFGLHRTLEAAGIKSIVVNAASIEVAARDRVKTDRRDSMKMAIQLDAGRLRGIRVPTVEEESQRLLHRTREQLIRTRTQCVNRVRMRFYQFGINLPSAISTKKVRKELESDKLTREFKQTMELLLVVWDTVNAQIAELKKQQEEQAKNDSRETRYRSLPGVGPQTARVLSCEVGDMSQFSNERKLFSFVGLTPCENSSGDSQRKGHISRQGSARMRCVLVEAAWNAVRYDAYFRSCYSRLAVRVGGKKAIVAIARKLIGIARALFRTGELYQQPEALKSLPAAA